jgi:hypothetical protein
LNPESPAPDRDFALERIGQLFLISTWEKRNPSVAPMHSYRLYCLDQAGHIVQAHELVAPDDGAAAEAASATAPYRWELWEGSRLAARSDEYQRRRG